MEGRGRKESSLCFKDLDLRGPARSRQRLYLKGSLHGYGTEAEASWGGLRSEVGILHVIKHKIGARAAQPSHILNRERNQLGAWHLVMAVYRSTAAEFLLLCVAMNHPEQSWIALVP